MEPAVSRRFAVAFSYAGEDRTRVAPLADALARRFGRERVLYDRFHEAEFARVDLDVYLPRLYRDNSDLIVVVLSPDYPRKRWCGLEIRSIRQLLGSPDSQRIMLLSLGDPGDLSDLGILSGDGYLEISHRSAAEVVDRILERLAMQGGPVAGLPAAGSRRWRAGLPLRSGRWLLLASGLLLLPLAWHTGRERLAGQELEVGDRAFSAYDKALTASEQRRHLEQAEAAWRRAAQLAPSQSAPQARLGFVYDLRGELPEARAAYERARDREPPDSSAARSYRIGLASVLAQQPGGQRQALEAYKADPDHPRAAVELAMLRWSDPTALPEALDAVSSPELVSALADRSSPNPGWSFPLDGGRALLVLHRPRQQRCLLTAVRASTRHLLGQQSPPPLAAADCQGLQVNLQNLLCSRLQAAAANPRSTATARWLGCRSGGGRSGASLAISATG